MSDRVKRLLEILNQNVATNRPSASPAYPNRPSLQQRSTTPTSSGYKAFKAARDRARAKASRPTGSGGSSGSSGSSGGGSGSNVTIKVSPSTSEGVNRKALIEMIEDMHPADQLKLALALKERRERA